MKARLLLLPLLVVALDQWSKWLVETFLGVYQRVPVVPNLFDLSHVRNTGIAFGLFPSRGELFGTLLLAVLGLVALGMVSVYYHRTGSHQRLLLVALALIMGGAVGNLIDRLLFGAVTDFLDVYISVHHWPTFNLADSAITIGICLLALETVRAPRNVAERSSANPISTPERAGS
jgi:signal peptidase II